MNDPIRPRALQRKLDGDARYQELKANLERLQHLQVRAWSRLKRSWTRHQKMLDQMHRLALRAARREAELETEERGGNDAAP